MKSTVRILGAGFASIGLFAACDGRTQERSSALQDAVSGSPAPLNICVTSQGMKGIGDGVAGNYFGFIVRVLENFGQPLSKLMEDLDAKLDPQMEKCRYAALGVSQLNGSPQLPTVAEPGTYDFGLFSFALKDAVQMTIVGVGLDIHTIEINPDGSVTTPKLEGHGFPVTLPKSVFQIGNESQGLAMFEKAGFNCHESRYLCFATYVPDSSANGRGKLVTTSRDELLEAFKATSLRPN